MKNLIRLAKLIIDCRLFISIAAVGLAMSTFKIFQIAIDWKVLIVVFFLTFVAYTFPVFLKQIKFSTRWIAFFVVYSFTGLYCAFQFWALSNNLISILFGILFFTTLFYYLPLGIVGRLRDLPFLKVFLISFAWTITTVFIPLAFTGGALFSVSVLWLTLERFLFLIAVTIPFDVRDIRTDTADGLLTLPSKFGLKGALYLSFVLLMMYLGITFAHYGLENILFVRAICVMLVLILIQKISLKKTSYYYTGLIDGSIIFKSILVQIIV